MKESSVCAYGKYLNAFVFFACVINTFDADDNAVTKALISLHLRLSVACGPWTGTDRAAQGSEGATRDMAKDIHVVAGDIDADDVSCNYHKTVQSTVLIDTLLWVLLHQPRCCSLNSYLRCHKPGCAD